MAIRTINALLALVFLGSFALMWASRRDVHAPNWEFLPEMVRAPRADAFSASAVFRDGKTLQVPPAGTIAQGHLPLHYGPTEEEAIRAGRELQNPFAPDDRAALARGEQVFATFCAPCHGPGGQGNGPVVAYGVPPPPSLVDGRALALADGHLFHILTYGQNNMAAYATQISREDRWRVILYIRSLQARATSQPVGP